MADAFYRPQDDGWFLPSEHTAGPWSPDSQHLGPPSALLTRQLECCGSAHDMLLTRITVEILGPVPIEELHVSAQVQRPGKAVEMLEATLATSERTVACARAWRTARSDSSGQAVGASEPLPPVESGVEHDRPDDWSPGYLDAMQWRGVHGSFAEPGPATVWVRQRIPLVDGEEPTPLQRLMTAADSVSGISTWLDPSRWLFINTELTVHIHRTPAGEWLGLDANTVIGPEGAGTALGTLHDEQGHVANSTQALLVRPR